MNGDRETVGRRLPRSPHSPRRPVIYDTADGGIAVLRPCPSCKRDRVYLASPAEGCCDDDHVATFTATHEHAADYNPADDYPDAASLRTIAANYTHNGPHYADPYYSPSSTSGRTVDPGDLGV